MGAKARKAMKVFAQEMDRREGLCLVLDRLVEMGQKLKGDEKRIYDQWVREGKPRWRDEPRIVARVRKAARKAARRGI